MFVCICVCRSKIDTASTLLAGATDTHEKMAQDRLTKEDKCQRHLAAMGQYILDGICDYMEVLECLGP